MGAPVLLTYIYVFVDYSNIIEHDNLVPGRFSLREKCPGDEVVDHDYGIVRAVFTPSVNLLSAVSS